MYDALTDRLEEGIYQIVAFLPRLAAALGILMVGSPLPRWSSAAPTSRCTASASTAGCAKAASPRRWSAPVRRSTRRPSLRSSSSGP
jgi:hypothetical protein